MRRREERIHSLVESRWPKLQNFLVLHFHEDTDLIWGSDENALKERIENLPTDYLKQILQEWRNLNDEANWDDKQIVELVQRGFGVNRVLKNPAEARTFMTHIFEEILANVRARTSDGWKK